MPVSNDYLAFLLDQLRPSGSVTARRMFGGVGLYLDGVFFGIVDDGLYFKVDDTNRPDYEARRCKQFTFQIGKVGKSVAMGYFAVPEDVIEDADELKAWARKALAVALAAAVRKARPASGRKQALKKKARRR